MLALTESVPGHISWCHRPAGLTGRGDAGGPFRTRRTPRPVHSRRRSLMKRSLTPLAAAVLVLAAACSDGDPTPTEARSVGPAPLLAVGGRAVEGSYIVVLNEGANPRSVAGVAGVNPQFVYTAVLNGFSASLNA